MTSSICSVLDLLKTTNPDPTPSSVLLPSVKTKEDLVQAHVVRTYILVCTYYMRSGKANELAGVLLCGMDKLKSIDFINEIIVVKPLFSASDHVIRGPSVVRADDRAEFRD